MYRFDFHKFMSWFLAMVGCVGLIVALIAACENEDFSMFLWCIPAIACAAAGFAILD